MEEYKIIKRRIKKINVVENADTFDIQTRNHNFFANRILVHNCEIILRIRSLCNLTEVVVRSGDTLKTLLRKVRLATILGTIQSTLTNFSYVSSEWKKNAEEERLLGVSLTGILDSKLLNGMDEDGTFNPNGRTEKLLKKLKNEAIETNKELSGSLGINPAAAITCVKPSGTVSQLVDSSSGIHARYSPFYIRRVKGDKKDPLARFMKEKGFSVEDDYLQPEHTYVFSFPQKSPKNSVFSKDRTAIQQLELWKVYQDFWCEHKPSITVNVQEHEWLDVGAWVYRNFDYMSGVSFLPYDGHSYRQAPYEEITEDEYKEMENLMPKNIDWTEFQEEEDKTTGAQELSCTAGACEVVNIGK